MTDFYADPVTPKARKRHRCVACWHYIEPAEKYVMQSGFYDGAAFRSKYHAECWDELRKEGPTFEFSPGDIEPPARLLGKGDSDDKGAT